MAKQYSDYPTPFLPYGEGDDRWGRAKDWSQSYDDLGPNWIASTSASYWTGPDWYERAAKYDKTEEEYAAALRQYEKDLENPPLIDIRRGRMLGIDPVAGKTMINETVPSIVFEPSNDRDQARIMLRPRLPKALKESPNGFMTIPVIHDHKPSMDFHGEASVIHNPDYTEEQVKSEFEDAVFIHDSLNLYVERKFKDSGWRPLSWDQDWDLVVPNVGVIMADYAQEYIENQMRRIAVKCLSQYRLEFKQGHLVVFNYRNTGFKFTWAVKV